MLCVRPFLRLKSSPIQVQIRPKRSLLKKVRQSFVQQVNKEGFGTRMKQRKLLKNRMILG